MWKVHPKLKGHRVSSIDTKSNSLGGLLGTLPQIIPPHHQIDKHYLGLPEWNTETHKKYPKAFKEAIKTLLMIHSLDFEHQPRHPECPIWLPIEVIIHIINFAALGILPSSFIFGHARV